MIRRHHSDNKLCRSRDSIIKNFFIIDTDNSNQIINSSNMAFFWSYVMFFSKNHSFARSSADTTKNERLEYWHFHCLLQHIVVFCTKIYCGRFLIESAEVKLTSLFWYLSGIWNRIKNNHVAQWEVIAALVYSTKMNLNVAH